MGLFDPVKPSSADLAVRTDDVGSITYVGYAFPGTATSSASWQIFRLTESAGDLVKEYADGNSKFDNVWDNRASLSYS